MWPFDYFKKKRERELQAKREEEAKRQAKLKEEQSARERQKRLEENRRKEKKMQEKIKADKESASKINPFTFKSNCHQRFENGSPVMGLQNCVRTVSVVKNTNGCPGYRMEPGKGYIVKVYNDDLGKPNMSDKPMIVVSKTNDKIVLRGFPIEAQTPFGWQEVDYRDYGLTVYYNGNEVCKCTLHMHDRNIDIEYRKVATKNSSNSNGNTKKASIKNKESEAEGYVQTALSQLSIGNDGDAVYHPLYKAWKSICRDPKQLSYCKNIGNIGMGMMIFLSYGTVQDIDDKQQISSIGYLCLSLALRNNPNDANLLKNRLLLMLMNREAFEYTVSSVVNKDKSIMFISMSPFTARDAMFKMEYADLSKDPRLLSIDMLRTAKADLQNKINSGFFGNSQTERSIIAKGEEHHKEVLDYLVEKVIDDEDVDF